MAKFLPALDERLTTFIQQQRIFFTGTAPGNGRMNVSPKGLDTFRILEGAMKCMPTTACASGRNDGTSGNEL